MSPQKTAELIVAGAPTAEVLDGIRALAEDYLKLVAPPDLKDFHAWWARAVHTPLHDRTRHNIAEAAFVEGVKAGRTGMANCDDLICDRCGFETESLTAMWRHKQSHATQELPAAQPDAREKWLAAVEALAIGTVPANCNWPRVWSLQGAVKQLAKDLRLADARIQEQNAHQLESDTRIAEQRTQLSELQHQMELLHRRPIVLRKGFEEACERADKAEARIRELESREDNR